MPTPTRPRSWTRAADQLAAKLRARLDLAGALDNLQGIPMVNFVTPDKIVFPNFDLYVRF